MKKKRGLPPIRVPGGLLLWDFDVRAVRSETTGRFTVRVRLHHTGRTAVETGDHPFPALARAMVRLTRDELGLGELHGMPKMSRNRIAGPS